MCRKRPSLTLIVPETVAVLKARVRSGCGVWDTGMKLLNRFVSSGR